MENKKIKMKMENKEYKIQNGKQNTQQSAWTSRTSVSAAAAKPPQR